MKNLILKLLDYGFKNTDTIVSAYEDFVEFKLSDKHYYRIYLDKEKRIAEIGYPQGSEQVKLDDDEIYHLILYKIDKLRKLVLEKSFQELESMLDAEPHPKKISTLDELDF